MTEPDASQSNEIVAMSHIERALAPLDFDAQLRVTQWQISKFQLQGKTVLAKADDGTLLSDSQPETAERDEPAFENRRSRYESFVDLYDAANPSSPGMKVLVGAYWIQCILGNPNFNSRQVHGPLQDMGHKIISINKVFTRLIDKSPALVRQVSKNGRHQRAQKTYKLTDAGKREVETLLTSGR